MRLGVYFGQILSCKIFKNMLQLTGFIVYLEGILNKNNDYFQIDIMIRAAHMLGAVRKYVPSNFF